MRDRTAIDAIKGYFYQFDYSIDQILSLQNENDNVIIEGIEDIDIKTATESCAIQCKYYSKSEYNHSVIAEPVRQMLNHFAAEKKAKKSKIKYKLRGYYKSGQNKLSLPLTLKALKDNFLTYKRENVIHEHHTELGLGDKDLIEFISCLEIDINAKDFDIQFNDLIKALTILFGCTDFSAEYFYYNNALRVIRELSIKCRDADRTISKKGFLKMINTSKILFDEWFVNIRGEKQHFLNLRKEYFTSLNISSFERFFLLEVDPVTYKRNEVKELLFLISRKWSKLSVREPKPFCPYVFIHGIVTTELIELKKELMTEGFLFWDGFDFEGANFNSKSITRRADSHNQVKIKMINSLDFLELIIAEISKTKEFYQFYLKNSYYDYTNPAVKHIRIQVNEFSKIKHIV